MVESIRIKGNVLYVWRDFLEWKSNHFVRLKANPFDFICELLMWLMYGVWRIVFGYTVNVFLSLEIKEITLHNAR